MFLFKLCATISISLCLITSISLITIAKAQLDATYAHHDCPNRTTFSPNSTYQSNLQELLSWLSSNATDENGYYNTTNGVNNNTVYGAFLCRGDLTADRCRECVSIAAYDVLQKCPVEIKSAIWYAECMLRYSNESFFSVSTEEPIKSIMNTANVSDQSRFLELLGQTVNKLVSEAANGNGGSTGKKFATEEAKFSSFQNLYTLAQCTPDLSVQDCNRCLQKATGRLISSLQGGRVLTPSCNVRYELYEFYTGVSSPAPTESPPPPEGKSGISAGIVVAIVVSILLALLLLIFACLFINRGRAKRKKNSVPEESVEISSVEFLQFDFKTIIVATNNFCDDNKLGEGGFGEVYKGSLANGLDVAVKRLSSSSRQAVEEFKNEVLLVAKLQHRNLVRLLGFCSVEKEKILIYEFVTNKSLDHFLFDPEKNPRLNWSRRYKIIEGIARGLLYLHEDSRFRIIHRDLKASNILLDDDLNPKISDFGLARIFDVDQTQANTNRIVGTFGYMSPEYAIHGHFSIKLDVYSFGILVLEIITGKKNTSFQESGYAEDLLNYAWKKWTDGAPLDLLDMSMRDSYSRDEVIRCIHMGLLCVQEDPAERPTMQTVVLMLSSQSVSVAMPQRPPSFLHSKTQPSLPTKGLETDTSTTTRKSIPLSVDESSITEVYPR